MDELQDRMTYAEYVEWKAFAANEPLPAQRADYHTAMLMTLLANIHRGKGGSKPKLTDFLPDWWEDNKRPAALARKFRALTANVKADAHGDNPRNARRQAGRRLGRLRQEA